MQENKIKVYNAIIKNENLVDFFVSYFKEFLTEEEIIKFSIPEIKEYILDCYSDLNEYILEYMFSSEDFLEKLNYEEYNNEKEFYNDLVLYGSETEDSLVNKMSEDEILIVNFFKDIELVSSRVYGLLH